MHLHICGLHYYMIGVEGGKGFASSLYSLQGGKLRVCNIPCKELLTFSFFLIMQQKINSDNATFLAGIEVTLNFLD